MMVDGFLRHAMVIIFFAILEIVNDNEFMISKIYNIGSILRLVLACSTFILMSACVSLNEASIQGQIQKNNCNQQSDVLIESNKVIQPLQPGQINKELCEHFSLRSIHVAYAIGLLSELEAYLTIKNQLRTQPNLETKVELLERTQAIYQRIHLASLEISAAASEMDCEEERTDQLANYLKGKEDEAETRLTVGAIVTGSLGAIIAGVLLFRGGSGDWPELIGIGSGLIETGLGVMILLNKRKILFMHTRNALGEIWEGVEASKIFPASVWYYLNLPDPQNNQKSLREQLVDKWMGFGQIANTKEKNKDKLYALFFGSGGRYTSEQLFNRANMHDQIEAYISLMKQDLKQLALEFHQLQNQ